MQIQAYRSPLVKPGDDLEAMLKATLPPLTERSVVVVASKIIATSENRFVPKTTDDKTEKHELVKREAEYYLDPHSSKYNLMLTIKHNWMFVNAGIDESNADGRYLLWPKDPQAAAERIWEFLRREYGLNDVGVTISDSTSIPLNWGVTGHAIAYCGFKQLRSYIDKPDLFGRPMKMEQTNVAQSLTAIASVEMGEGAEQTPVAVISDITGIEFQNHPPTPAELQQLHVELADDVFAPLLTSVEWQKGGSL